MYGSSFAALGDALIAGAIAIILLVCIAVYAATDYFFIDDCYKVKELIVPEVELIISNNKVDTVYVYRFK